MAVVAAAVAAADLSVDFVTNAAAATIFDIVAAAAVVVDAAAAVADAAMRCSSDAGIFRRCGVVEIKLMNTSNVL